MIVVFVVLVVSLLLLLWSADRFVEGSAAVAHHLGLSPLLIGMVIVGFGTSMPELLVSTMSAYQGNPNIALGNAYGSNISNIAIILGLTALITPLTIHSSVLKKELPLLLAVSLVASFQLQDGWLSRVDAIVLLGLFLAIMSWYIYEGFHKREDPLQNNMALELKTRRLPLKKGILYIAVGLPLLIGSARLLVWSAIKIAEHLGVSDILIGLTLVAIGTSLPELASSLMAGLKDEHDLAVGNILGSNLFNTLVVVGLAAIIKPMPVERIIFVRDIPVMIFLTLSLFVLGFGYRKPGRINRLEGALLLAIYGGYLFYLIKSS
ncbi:MAG: calcium/sodium antiporter [Candidatus Marinimicrobia bacterium]|nr:calcium/sodium antiporter [Candidatus Neomarinimicrobiota bacterium]